MTPSITVAVPLHRSTRWLDVITANVRALPNEVTHVVLSDRTCEDDAAEVLRARLADDPRVRVIAEPRGIGWVDHYQLLLDEATTDLFMWMPHDDDFEASWVPTLIDTLDRHPQAWIAWGHEACTSADGVTPVGTWPHPRPGVVRGWGALRLILHGEAGLPIRGLLRRRAILDSGLRFEHRPDFGGVDQLWVFAVALQSALVYDDRTETTKRFYAGSTHTQWGMERPGHLELEVVRLLHEHGPGGLQGLAMRSVARLAWVRGRLRPYLGPTWRALRGRQREGPAFKVAAPAEAQRSQNR